MGLTSRIIIPLVYGALGFLVNSVPLVSNVSVVLAEDKKVEGKKFVDPERGFPHDGFYKKGIPGNVNYWNNTKVVESQDRDLHSKAYVDTLNRVIAIEFYTKGERFPHHLYLSDEFSEGVYFLSRDDSRQKYWERDNVSIVGSLEHPKSVRNLDTFRFWYSDEKHLFDFSRGRLIPKNVGK